ncbi:MAG TPA: extracellular solute-binding protein [Limnochordia bacterium]
MRRRLLISMAVFMAALVYAGAGALSKEVLRVGHHWSGAGPEAESVEAIIAYYQQAHPEVTVEPVPGLWPMDKFYTLIAAGDPPDVMIGLGSDVAEYVRQGILLPLTAYARQDGVAANRFWAPAWQGVVFEGELWGLPAWVDPNFALLANAQLLAEAGLPADAPPKTIPELEIAMEKLTHRDASGRLTQLGMRPWSVYGPWNTLVTWFWAFGGRDLYDAEARRLRFNTDPVIRAMSWVADKYQRYSGGAGVGSMREGQVAMELITGGSNIRQYLEVIPDLVAGVTPYHPDAGTERVAWVGGHIMVVPKGAANPERAWEFMRTVSATPEGALTWAKAGRITGFRSDEAITYLHQDRVMRIMVNVLESAAYIRPRIPVPDLDGKVGPTLSRIWSGEVAPRSGLESLNDTLQAQVDAYYASLAD